MMATRTRYVALLACVAVAAVGLARTARGGGSSFFAAARAALAARTADRSALSLSNKGVQTTPDNQHILVSKDVGNERLFDQIGGVNAWESDEISTPLLDASRIRALQSEGVHFGSHSMSHRPLAHIPAEEASLELTRSRGSLTDLLGREVDVFAYPFSNQSTAVRALVREAGYRCAVRGKGRMNSVTTDPFGLRRIKIEPTTTVEGLRRTLVRERYLRLF